MEAVQVRITHIFTSPGHDFKGRHGQARLANGTEAHEGVDVNDLLGRTFSLGGVRFEGTEASHPCHWMDVALVPGTRDLLKGKGGLRAKILESGILHTGEADLVLEDPLPYLVE